MLKAAPQACRKTFWIKVKGRHTSAKINSRVLQALCKEKYFPCSATVHAAGKNPPNPWYEVEMPAEPVASSCAEICSRSAIALKR